jgi:3-deoxy-D-manno-octulosonic-acid transferase
MNWPLYSFVTRIASPLAGVLVRIALPGRDEERAGRLGRYVDVSGASPIWLHAASAGETEGAEPLVREIRRELPGAPIVITSMTRAGRSRASRIEGVRSLFAPIDLPGAVSSAFRRLRPRALLLVETEIWPNLLAEAERRGVPVAVVNGRISARAFGRMRFARPLYRSALGRVALFGVQRAIDRDRFEAFGVGREKIFVHGNTKIDTAAPDPPDPRIRKSGDEKWVVFGSVRPGEEEAVLWTARAILASRADAGVVVAPRHPDRAGLFLRTGDPGWMRWSERREGERSRAILVDTVGELLSFYRTADVAFVGGSLSRHGGHNPIEPARFGVPVLMGPHRENCRELSDLLERAGALEVVADGAALERRILALLADDDERRRRGEAGRAAVEAERGAASRCVRRLSVAGLLMVV